MYNYIYIYMEGKREEVKKGGRKEGRKCGKMLDPDK